MVWHQIQHRKKRAGFASIEDLDAKATVSKRVSRQEGVASREWLHPRLYQSSVEGYSAHGTWLQETFLPQTSDVKVCDC